jgi:hypothetical protein
MADKIITMAVRKGGSGPTTGDSTSERAKTLRKSGMGGALAHQYRIFDMNGIFESRRQVCLDISG